MRYVRQYYDTALILVILWCILSESFTLATLAIGLLYSLITILIIHLMFSNNDDVKNYRVPPRLIIWYLYVLIHQIIIAGLHVSKQVITGHCNPQVVTIKTTVHNHWFQCIIANSITLTPGTVTIDKTDHTIQVLWLYPTTDDPDEQARLILGPFEHILKKGDYSR